MKIRYIAFGNSKQSSQSSIAAYNRMSLTCSGLYRNGFNAEICEIYSLLLNKKYFHYFGHLFCVLKTTLVLLMSKKNDIIIIYDQNPYYFIFKFFYKRRRLFAELHEFPAYLISDSISARAVELSKRFEKTLSYFEGIITCSYVLKNYYQKFTNSNCSYLVLPLLLNLEKFAGDSFNRENYIAYCGDFGNNKDGVPILIKAFSIISSKYVNYQLKIAGGTNDNLVMSKLNDLVSELKLEDKVNFVGLIDHNKMPEFLGKASLLALARPRNKQAEGGVPSKIAEYLSTKRPVVVTKVGELDLYLKHNVNVFFSASDDAEHFAECIDMALSNYPKAEKIGHSGRKVAESFDYLKQSVKVLNFLLKR